MAVKSVVKRKVGGVAAKAVRARVARPRRAKSAAKPVATSAVAAAASSAAVAPPAPALAPSAAAAGRGRCPVCGSVKAEAPPVPRKLSAKERAADLALLRRLQKKYPPNKTPHLLGKPAVPIYELFAPFRRAVAKHGGADELFAILDRGRE